jgi:hypothetical protein
MQWLLGGRSDMIAETVRRKACVEGWEQCEKGINQSLFLKRLTEAICRESQKSRLTKLHKITDSKFIYLLQLNRENPIPVHNNPRRTNEFCQKRTNNRRAEMMLAGHHLNYTHVPEKCDGADLLGSN